MTRRGRSVAIVMAALAALALVGCKTAKPSSSSTPPSGVTSGAAAPSPTKAALPKGGKCVLLTVDQATALLGSTPKSSASSVTGAEGVVHVDGCTYTGSTANLGYDINDYSGSAADPKVVVQQGQIAVASAPGAQKFDVPGGDLTLGFTMPIGGKTMARIEIVTGKITIGVNAVSGNPATAKQIALSAATVLLTAIG